MKKLFILLLVIVSSLLSLAQKVGQEMYIYRNNGQVNGFLPNEILSIDFSNIDADGNIYNEVVSQVLNTPDSTYIIPLAEIDSISFVTPKTEYQPDVVNLSESLMPYISSSDSLTFYLLSTTPEDLLPTKGTKLVTVEMNDKFPSGFAGEVVNVSKANDGYKVECTLTSLEEIFKTYYKVSSAYFDEDQTTSGSRQSWYERNLVRSVNPHGFYWNYGAELSQEISDNGRWALKGSTELSIGIRPTFHLNSTLIVNQREGCYFMLSLTGAIYLEEKISIYGGINYHYGRPFRNLTIEVPVPECPFLRFYIEPGLFIDANAVVTGSLVWNQTFTFGTAFDYSSRGQNAIKPTLGGRLASSDFDIQACLDGSFAAGLYIESGVRVLCEDVSSVCVRGKLGGEFVGSFMISDDDVRLADNNTKLYERLKESSFSVNAFGKTSTEATVARWGICQSLPWNLSYNINEWNVVPSFSDMSSNRQVDNSRNYTVNSQIKGNLLFPVKVGFGLFNDVNEFVQPPLFNDHQYRLETNWPHNSFTQTFEGIKPGDKYTCSPMVNFLGIEMRATPSISMGEELSLETGKINNITSSTADAIGHIVTEDLNIIAGCEYGICITEKYSTEDWDYIPSDNLDRYGNFSVTFKDLKPNTEYIYCAYIELAEDEYLHGDEKSFVTESIQVSTGDFSNVNSNSAVTNGKLDANGLSNISQYIYGIRYMEKGTSNEWIYILSNNLNNYGNYSVSLTNLKPNTEYIYCAYIKVEDIFLYGEEKTFKTDNEEKPQDGFSNCPDNNHPHMIDLGLPSGTKWACCNVGAKSPEGYGVYYAWGETKRRSKDFQYDLYPYFAGFIGLDIAGTKYDAATANWGEPWRMPSVTQMDELIKNTTSTWTSQNGVHGKKFTGPNGGSIFFPAAGALYQMWYTSGKLFEEGINGAGEGCYYWTSTQSDQYDYYAWLLVGSESRTAIYGNKFASGLSVRPVQ